MINLLPEKTLKKVKKEYTYRFLIVGCVAIAILMIFWIVGLVPSYIFATKRIESLENFRQLRVEKSDNLFKTDSKTTLDRLIYTTNLVTSAPPQPLEVYNALVEQVISGININMYTIVRNEAGDGFDITVSGTSETRQALVDYSNKIANDGRFANVDVPISVFVIEKNTPFNLTATYSYDQN